MRTMDARARPATHHAEAFASTHWSVIIEAGAEGTPEADLALERLCQTYWYPLYAYVRRQGQSPHDAQDLTQAFFARFLQRKYFSHADQSRGKFRSFLLASMHHFLVNEWTKERAAKRGGFERVISLDERQAEERYEAESLDNGTPDRLFEKRWAAGLLERVLARLREENANGDRALVFEALKDFLWGEKNGSTYQELGLELAMSEGAVKVAVYRLRQRYRDLLREEVAQTVASPEEVDEELRYLISVIRG